MEYCKRCLYPENAKPTILIDEDGVCSGCRYNDSRANVDWGEREGMLSDLLAQYRDEMRAKDVGYDCIVPVSGGKDSTFQVQLVKEKYGLNPLLVTFNHSYNTHVGVENLRNLVEKTGCDLIRQTANPQSVRKISRHMLKTVGDLTWHYHSGIFTFPFQVATKYEIPLIIWGEEGYAELTGMFSIDDFVEFTKWKRKEHDMRGFDAEDIVGEGGITKHDIQPYVFPSDEAIDSVGVRGIYLSNFIEWDALKQAKAVISDLGFNTYHGKRDRTFNLYAKTDDHANDFHDWLKYVKFGYGRATDDASYEIRQGRMTREEGIEAVRQYDATTPRTLGLYLDFLQVSETELFEWIDPMRDPAIWEQDERGNWIAKDSVLNHANDPGVDEVRVPLVPEDERTFSERYKDLYFSQKWWGKDGERPLGTDEKRFLEGFVVL